MRPARTVQVSISIYFGCFCVCAGVGWIELLLLREVPANGCELHFGPSPIHTLLLIFIHLLSPPAKSWRKRIFRGKEVEDSKTPPHKFHSQFDSLARLLRSNPDIAHHHHLPLLTFLGLLSPSSFDRWENLRPLSRSGLTNLTIPTAWQIEIPGFLRLFLLLHWLGMHLMTPGQSQIPPGAGEREKSCCLVYRCSDQQNQSSLFRLSAPKVCLSRTIFCLRE